MSQSPSIALVAAKSLNNVIGKGLDIPWQVKGEQKLFKHITAGGTLIMGRLTYDSIGRPLPGRKTIIITRNLEYRAEACDVVHDLESALATAATFERPVFVVGGGEIYRQTLDVATDIHLTTIEAKVDGDVFFPTFNQDDFELISEEQFESNINYTYRHFKRRA